MHTKLQREEQTGKYDPAFKMHLSYYDRKTLGVGGVSYR